MNFFEKMKGFLLKPSQTFNACKDESLGEAIKYFVYFYVIVALISIPLSLNSKELASFLGLETYGIGGIFILFALIIGILIEGAFTHIGVYLFGGRKGINQTIKAVFYSTAILILFFIVIEFFKQIPYNNNIPLFIIDISEIIAGIWTLVLIILGVRQLHEITTLRATMGVLFINLIPIILILLVMGLVLVNYPSTDDSNEGINLSEEGNYTEAIRAFDEALKINPQNATTWNEKGMVLAKLRKYDDAIKAYDEALKINPQNVDAWKNKGNALRNLGRYEEAFEAWDEALKINPQFAKAWFSKGNALSDLGKYEEAIKAYDEALKINPKDNDTWNNKGNALSNIGRYEEAIKALDEALKINSQDAEVWYNKGLAFAGLGKYEEEIKAYDEALKINPQDADVWFNKGIALSDLGRYDEAIKAYDEALMINPQFRPAWVNKGNVLSKLGRNDEANKAFDEAKKLPGFGLISAIIGLVLIMHSLRRK